MQTAEYEVCVVFSGDEGSICVPFSPFYLRDDQAFFDFCQYNDPNGLRYEREADGEVRLMPPSGSDTGKVNAEILTELQLWNRQQGRPGYVFDSSAGFKLPDSAVRAPDVSYVLRDRYDALSDCDREHYAPIAPDFVIEVMSPTDRLKAQQDKMQEYIDNGVRLGWLIDRKERTVYVYRPGEDVLHLANPDSVAADPELPGFILPLDRIF